MYILKCGDGSYYTGSTTNLDLRIAEHQAGKGAKYTQDHQPVELVYSESFPDISTAAAREKQIKGWSHRKKTALISGDIAALTKKTAPS
jgi:putative endonuclease